MTREREVAAWLNTLERTRAEAVKVRIDDTWHDGAYYRQTRNTPEGTRAYREGERTYEQRGYYLLGALPSSYREYEPDDERAPVLYVAEPRTLYYVASFYEGDTHDYHPFGACFQLFPHTSDVPEGTTEVPILVLADQG